MKNTFIFTYDLDDPDKPEFDKFIVTFYFVLTTLSTVGYGDYHPISNIERLIAAFYMLIGVALFSYVMSDFIGIIADYSTKMG